MCVCVIVHVTGCTSICVWGTSVGSFPVLPPQAVFAEARHRCCGLAEVNKGVQAGRLLLIGSQAEALALPIKPVTQNQLTPDSLSAYVAWRLRANRQRQRRRGGLFYWREVEKKWNEGEGGEGRTSKSV